MALLTSSLAYLTGDVPGTGGVIKQRHEDFIVEEQPLYEPTGEGEHLMIFVEKENRATTDTVKRLARVFKVRRGDIGYAGLKDKRAITRQHMTVHLPDPSQDEFLLNRIGHTPIKLLWAARHRNKLKRGHLAGNRFVIKIRDTEATHVTRAKQAIDRLVTTGVPNFLGEQRFGYRQNNHLLGRALLKGDWQAFLDELCGKPHPDDPTPTRTGREAYERGDYAAALDAWPKQLRQDRQALDALRQGKRGQEAVECVDAQQREFVINAFQSIVFNDLLDARVRAGLLGQLLPGDLAWKHDSRAVFAVDEATAELENGPTGRVPRLEVSPSGPMWGYDMSQTKGQVGQWELAALEKYEVTLDDLGTGPYTVDGRRRPMRIKLRDAEVSGGADEHGPFIRLAFTLPRGSFATIVTREVIKPDDPASLGGEGPEDEE